MSDTDEPKVVKKWVIGQLKPIEVNVDGLSTSENNYSSRRASTMTSIGANHNMSISNIDTTMINKSAYIASPRRSSLQYNPNANQGGDGFVASLTKKDSYNNEKNIIDEEVKKKKKKKKSDGTEENNDGGDGTTKKKKKKKKKIDGEEDNNIDGEGKKKKKKKKKIDGGEDDNDENNGEVKKKKIKKKKKVEGDINNGEQKIATKKKKKDDNDDENKKMKGYDVKPRTFKPNISSINEAPRAMNNKSINEDMKGLPTNAATSSNIESTSNVVVHPASVVDNDSRFKSYVNPAIERRKVPDRTISSNAVNRANRVLANAANSKNDTQPTVTPTPAWITKLKEAKEESSWSNYMPPTKSNMKIDSVDTSSKIAKKLSFDSNAVEEKETPASKSYAVPVPTTDSIPSYMAKAPTNSSIWSTVPSPPPKTESVPALPATSVKAPASTTASMKAPASTRSIPVKKPPPRIPVRNDSSSSLESTSSKNKSSKPKETSSTALAQTDFLALQRKLDALSRKDRDIIDRCNEIQKKIEDIEFEKNEAMESIKIDLEKKKQAFDKQAMERFLQNLDRKDKNAEILEANQLEVTKIRNENAKLRTNIKDFHQSIHDMKISKERLLESKTASENYVNQLTNHIETTTADAVKLKNTIVQYKAAVEMVEDRYNEFNNYYMVECTVKAIYTQLVSSILSMVDSSITDTNKTNDALLLELYEIAEPILSNHKNK